MPSILIQNLLYCFQRQLSSNNAEKVKTSPDKLCKMPQNFVLSLTERLPHDKITGLRIDSTGAKWHTAHFANCPGLSRFAGMVELVDSVDLGSTVDRRAGSSPVARTIWNASMDTILAFLFYSKPRKFTWCKTFSCL